jgi:hypothetical protein
MEFFDIIYNIYKKEKIAVTKFDTSLCISLTSVLKNNKNNLQSLKSMIEYLFFIEPKHYVMLLFVLIPKTTFIPFSKKIEKQEKKEDILYNKIAYLFDWGRRELNLYKNLLDKVIDREFWKEELGIK